MKTYLLGLIGMSLLFSLTTLQATTYSGYIVTIEGDTIEGKIPGRGLLKMQDEITFKSKVTGTRKFTPDMIRGFMLSRLAQYYCSIDVSPEIGRKFLLERYTDGTLSSYKYFYRTGKGKKRSATVILKDNQVVKINWTNLATPADYAEVNKVAEGGIIRFNGDTLTGWLRLNYTKDDNHLRFKKRREDEFEKIDIETIAGYFVEDMVFTRIQAGEKGKKDKLAFLLVDGEIQLFVDYKKVTSSLPVGSFGTNVVYVPYGYLEEDLYYQSKVTKEIIRAKKILDWVKVYYPECSALEEQDYGKTIDHIVIAEMINLRWRMMKDQK